MEYLLDDERWHNDPQWPCRGALLLASRYHAILQLMQSCELMFYVQEELILPDRSLSIFRRVHCI
jgi:hypothetical protein